MVTFGVDGCRSGWLYVSLDRGRLGYGTVPELRELVDRVPKASRMFVDIPIGLRDDGELPRGCDVEARRLLGRGRASSVFPAPLRPVLQAASYTEALRRSRALSGKGLSKQTYNIAGKIREVDLLLRGSARAREMIRESHPEVCFWALAGGTPMTHCKKLDAGFEERMTLLEASRPGSRALAQQVLQHTLRRDVARDDIADALVLAVTAATPRRRLRSLPAQPLRDSFDLPMEIVHPTVRRLDRR